MSRNLSANHRHPRRWCGLGGHWATALTGSGTPFICYACSRKGGGKK